MSILFNEIRCQFEKNLAEVKEDNEIEFSKLVEMAEDRTLEDLKNYLSRIAGQRKDGHMEAINLHIENKPLPESF